MLKTTYKKGGTGYVLVSTQKTHENKTGITGVNGHEIINDTSYSPEKHAINTATVVSVPLSKGKQPLMQIPCGEPGYGATRVPPEGDENISDAFYSSKGVYDYIFLNDIQENVEIGDQIFFKNRILNNKSNYLEEFTDENGTHMVFKVHYSCIYGILHKESITMVGTWTLIAPIYEDWDDILIPTYTDFKDGNGDFIPRPKDKWIQTKVAPEHDNLHGHVFKVGLPYKGHSSEIVNGMKVVFRPETIVWADVNGNKYMIVRQDNIIAYITD